MNIVETLVRKKLCNHVNVLFQGNTVCSSFEWSWNSYVNAGLANTRQLTDKRRIKVTRNVSRPAPNSSGLKFWRLWKTRILCDITIVFHNAPSTKYWRIIEFKLAPTCSSIKIELFSFFSREKNNIFPLGFSRMIILLLTPKALFPGCLNSTIELHAFGFTSMGPRDISRQ